MVKKKPVKKKLKLVPWEKGEDFFVIVSLRPEDEIEFNDVVVPNVDGLYKSLDSAKEYLADHLTRSALQTIDRTEASWINFKNRNLECVFVYIGEGEVDPAYVIIPSKARD